MRTRMMQLLLVAAVVIVAGCAGRRGGVAATSQAGREKVLVNRSKEGVALQGYDPVAYFTDGKPVKGIAKYSVRHHGATYYFASDEHRQMFLAEPAKYEPQFGGYCGYAASINKLSPISPEYWEIIDGRLVLQHNQKAWDLWHKDVPGNLMKADANWPGLVARNGTLLKTLVNVDASGVALQGYDPVAYFTEGKPVMGSPELLAVYNGATYHFASAEHKDTFEQDPAKYEPQFGGYCGYAASIKKISPINPHIFQIIDGRLVLQHTQKAYDLFNKDAYASLMRADRNWPGLVQKHGK